MEGEREESARVRDQGRALYSPRTYWSVVRDVLVFSASASALHPSARIKLYWRLWREEREESKGEGEQGRALHAPRTYPSTVRDVLVFSASASALHPSSPILLPTRLWSERGKREQG